MRSTTKRFSSMIFAVLFLVAAAVVFFEMLSSEGGLAIREGLVVLRA